MSRKLGSRTYGKKEELIFLGRDIQETRNYSDETAHAIDQEVSSILADAHRRAKEILTKHRTKLEEIAERLIKEETLDEETFSSMFDQPFEPVQGADDSETDLAGVQPTKVNVA